MLLIDFLPLLYYNVHKAVMKIGFKYFQDPFSPHLTTINRCESKRLNDGSGFMNNEKNYKELLSRSANKYKLSLHTHSTFSDGNFTPEQLKKMYMAEGYSAIAFSDHGNCIPHTELTDENFVALTAVELDFNIGDENGKLASSVHLNAIAKNPTLARQYKSELLDYEFVNETIRNLKDDGFFVTVNHPVWSNLSTDDLLKIQGADAVEVHNSLAVFSYNYSDDSAFYEYFLRKGGRALPIAADDTHNAFEDGSPFLEYYKGFTMVAAPELSYTSIMDALSAGNIFASTGPLFESIWLEGDLLHVECSPVCGVYVHSKCMILNAHIIRKTDSITHAVIDISKIREGSPYFWVQLRNTHGEKAWSAPFWFEKL